MKGHSFQGSVAFSNTMTRTRHHRISMNLCSLSCLVKFCAQHGNVVRKHADGTCSCFGQHVNKAQERRMCRESELGLHV